MSTRAELDALLSEAESFVSQFITRAIGADTSRILPDVTAAIARYWQPDTFAAKPPSAQQAVNKYQLDLQKAYTDWYEDTADDLAEADEDEQEEIWAAALLVLLALLKQKGRDGMADAVGLALGDEESFPELDELLDEQVAENDKYLTKSLIPDLKAAGLLALGAGSVKAITDALAGQTARVGSYAGEFWSLYNEAVGVVAKKASKKVIAYLDEHAQHCKDCPQFASEEGKEYESWDAYMEATGNRVPGDYECGPNCRCRLEFR